MTTNDVVGWLVWGLDKKGALCLGLLLLPPATTFKKVIPKVIEEDGGPSGF